MRHSVAFVLLAACLTMAVPAAADQSAADARLLEFSYSVRISDLPAGARSAWAWIPVPLSDEYQQLLGYTVAGGLDHVDLSEPDYGNRFLRLDLSDVKGGVAEFVVTFEVLRHSQQAGAGAREALDAASRVRYTEANALVPLSGPHTGEAAAVVEGERDAYARGRLLYDNIVATVEYDKSGEGWGRGDALYACDVRAGNCTDFHSLFIGQARSLGIPARFTMGFPVPAELTEGEIGGYHCWAEFWADGRGWVPIDASEARKHPELADERFGSLPADRVAFTRGRDYRLPGATAAPLNFLIYPHVEVDGALHASVERSFSFREVGAGEQGGRLARDW